MVTNDDQIQIQITAQVKEEFEKAAEHRGVKPAVLLSSLVKNAIKDAKKENPKLFRREIPIITLEEAIADDKRKRAEDKNKMPSEINPKAKG
jgi:glutamyl-tRNA reductase